ncbi:unnamed protein product [Symbiodinium microadriaticum]|nr:unnamed protein product [Symbiodinium sp. KB8]CAE7773437.1 unnamed protein product [Symbiodinium microadriaticum]
MSASKWKLTKKDEQEVQKVGTAAREAALAAGKTAEEADAAKSEATEAEAKRIKEEKARKNEERKRAAAKSTATVFASKPSTEASEGQNGLYYAALTEAQETVLSHPVFKGIIAEEPLPITDSEILESGVQAVWSETEAVTAVRREKCYNARCLEYADFSYKKPRHLDPVHIDVESVEEVKALKGTAGNWKRISPEEPVHSLIFHLERLILQKDGDAASILDVLGPLTASREIERVHSHNSRLLFSAVHDDDTQVTGVMLSTTCRIELIEPEAPDMSFEDALYWKSYRIRVKVTAEDDLCKRTARQMAVEIHSFKMRKERVSGPVDLATLQDLYTSEAASVKSIVTANMVMQAMSIHEKLLQNIRIVQVLENLERMYGLKSCLNSMVKLKTIIEKTETDEERAWIVECLEDGLLQRPPALFNDSIGTTDLKGSASKLSLIELFKFKKVAYDYFLDLEAPRANFDLEHLKLSKEKCRDHKSYRAWCAPLTDTHVVDTTWQAKLKNSTQLLLKLLLELLYESGWHASIAGLFKNKKAALDSLKVEQAEEAAKTGAALGDTEEKAEAEEVDGQDSQLWAERARRPQYQAAPPSQDHVSKLLEGALKGRGATPVKADMAVVDRPLDADVVVLGDGGQNPGSLLHYFKQTTRDAASFPSYLETKNVTVMFSEQAVRKRKLKQRGEMEQVQGLHFISANPLEKLLPEKQFSSYPFSNRGGAIGYIHDSETPWQLTVEKKRKLYGSDHLVGGTGPLVKDDSDTRRADDIEPVFYRALPNAMWHDFVNAYSCAACLDLCARAGEVAKACLLAKKSYVGMCLCCGLEAFCYFPFRGFLSR